MFGDRTSKIYGVKCEGQWSSGGAIENFNKSKKGSRTIHKNNVLFRSYKDRGIIIVVLDEECFANVNNNS